MSQEMQMQTQVGKSHGVTPQATSQVTQTLFANAGTNRRQDASLFNPPAPNLRMASPNNDGPAK
jgi:hypothetical protein